MTVARATVNRGTFRVRFVLICTEALSQTVKFERNCQLAELPSDALPEGVIRTHRAIEADSEDAPIRPYNSDMCM